MVSNRRAWTAPSDHSAAEQADPAASKARSRRALATLNASSVMRRARARRPMVVMSLERSWPASVVIPKLVISRTALQGSRRGARAAVMPSHHKARATTAEGPARPPEGPLFPPSGGRHRRLPMLGHRPRDASYPEDGKSDPRYDEFRNHHTRWFGRPHRTQAWASGETARWDHRSPGCRESSTLRSRRERTPGRPPRCQNPTWVRSPAPGTVPPG